MGVIGACLPILRAPIAQFFPQWFTTKNSARRGNRYYYEDRGTDEYGMQSLPKRQKDGSQIARHNASVSAGGIGGGLFGGPPRKSSDELGIIEASPETMERYGDHDRGNMSTKHPHAIKKTVGVSVERTSY